MREIIVRSNGRIARITGDLFTGEYDLFNTPVFENDYVNVNIDTGFGSISKSKARVVWCDDCRGFNLICVDDQLKETQTIFDGSLQQIAEVITVNEKTS